VTALRGSLTRKAGALGPLPLRLPDANGSTATGSENIGLTFPASGAWTLQLTVQTSEFDAAVFSFTVPIA
jgi:hypothetical protein